jgi:hypothetical protein
VVSRRREPDAGSMEDLARLQSLPDENSSNLRYSKGCEDEASVSSAGSTSTCFCIFMCRRWITLRLGPSHDPTRALLDEIGKSIDKMRDFVTRNAENVQVAGFVSCISG